MSTITAIETPRRGSKRRRIVIDGEPWRETSAEVIATLGLTTATVVDLAELDRGLADAAAVCARERALRLLTVRERSFKNIVRRLVDDGYGEEAARSVVERLSDRGLVDDARFAASLARSRSAGGFARSRALRDLADAGVDEETAKAAVDEVLTPEQERSSAYALARRAAARHGATIQKVAASLARRGYGAGLALEAARAATRDADLDGGVVDPGDPIDEDPFHPHLD